MMLNKALGFDLRVKASGATDIPPDRNSQVIQQACGGLPAEAHQVRVAKHLVHVATQPGGC